MTTHFGCIEFSLPTGMHSDCRVSPSLPSMALWNILPRLLADNAYSPPRCRRCIRELQGVVLAWGVSQSNSSMLCYHSLWGVRKHSVRGDTPERVVERRDWRSR